MVIEKYNFLNKDLLIYLYHDKKLSAKQIGDIYNICHGTILYRMKKFNILRRNNSESLKLNNPMFNKFHKEKIMGEKNHFFGKTHTKETKEKMSKSHKEYFKTNKHPLLNKIREDMVGDLNPMKNPATKQKHSKKMNLIRNKFRGSKSPNWRGGKSNLKNKIRCLSEYKKWRTEIFKRDKYVCIFCKNNKNKINADHIIPFAKIINENNINSVDAAIQCKQLWDINNGRTLCVECHKKTNTFGGRTKT